MKSLELELSWRKFLPGDASVELVLFFVNSWLAGDLMSADLETGVLEGGCCSHLGNFG